MRMCVVTVECLAMGGGARQLCKKDHRVIRHRDEKAKEIEEQKAEGKKQNQKAGPRQIRTHDEVRANARCVDIPYIQGLRKAKKIGVLDFFHGQVHTCFVSGTAQTCTLVCLVVPLSLYIPVPVST